MDVKVLLGKRIREYRLRKKMTQAALAELVHVEPKHISCIECGKNYPSADLLDKIATVLEIEHDLLYKFRHLQEPTDLKSEIIRYMDMLDYSQLQVMYRFIRAMVV